MEARNSACAAKSPASLVITMAVAHKKASPSPIATPPAIAAALFGLNEVVGIAIRGIAVKVSVPLLVIVKAVVEVAVLE